MKIGILADIHGVIPNLRRAIDCLQQRNVDRFVVLGDVIFSSRDARETTGVLSSIGAEGVYGNHELGLCVGSREELAESYDYDAAVFDFFASLKDHFEIGDLLFSHTLPSQDPRDPTAYYLGAKPEQPGALEETFAKFPHRIVFVGHFHRWFAATPDGPIDWQGGNTLGLDADQRYFIVIHAVMEGWAAMLDTERNCLEPIHL